MKNCLLLLILTLIAAAGAARAQTVNPFAATDFANYEFQLDRQSVRMQNGLEAGACRQKDEDGVPIGSIWNVSAEAVAYGDLDGDGRAEAIVPLVANVCGGNMITDEKIVVLTSKNGRTTQLPEFDYFDEGCRAGEKGCDFTRSPGVTVRYDAAERALVVETSFAVETDALCCPSLARETWYKWNGKAFAETKKGRLVKRASEN